MQAKTERFEHRALLSAPVRRIAKADTNYFVVLFDPERDRIEPVCVVEIFAVGGRTPPNTHRRAHEFFYVLSGEGRAFCDGVERAIAKGDALMLRPGGEHVIENTGARKLYTLTFMTPDEGFAELIRAGEPVTLDKEDIETLTTNAPPGVN
jgi:mannose-6-phosphate isomerase-like protein (cupin superfamily)